MKRKAKREQQKQGGRQARKEEMKGWRGVAWRGVAWRGVAWRGVAWRGVAWRGVPARRT